MIKSNLTGRVLYMLWGLLAALLLSTAVPAAAANVVLIQSGFEDGSVQGWNPRGGVEVLTPSAQAAHSGAYGLLVSGRTKGWHGPTLELTDAMQTGRSYILSGWLKLPAGSADAKVYLSLQRSMADGEHYEQLASGNVTSSGWVKLEATYKLREAAERVAVYFEAPNQAAQSLLLDDFQLEALPDPGPIVIEEGIPSLKEVFADDFVIGTAFENFEMAGEADRKLLAKHFSILTPGNVLKWDSTEPAEGVFDFADSDAAVAFALQNGQQVRGHTLVWHNQTPDWVFRDASGGLASKELLYQRLKNHINTVMGRYKGQVQTWDVINEVIDASQPDGLRRSLWYQIAGEEFIEKAFLFAREADPAAKLFINDYNTHEPAKSQALYNLVQRLQAKGIPIDGVGHQTHIRIAFPSVQEIERSIVKFGALGLDQHITELDMGVYANDTDKLAAFPADLQQKQAAKYKLLFEMLKKRKNLITNVTLWGKDDGNTWLRSFPVSRNDWPLLFDERLQAKSAYWAIVGNVPAQAPAAPIGVAAAAGDRQVKLSWTPSAGADSYAVSRSTVSGGPYTEVASGLTAAAYTDTGLTNGTAYYYVVRAVNAAGASANSAAVSATPAGTVSEPVGSLVVQYRTGSTNAGDNSINPHFNIRNTSSAPVQLSGLKLRYYFTREGSAAMNSWVDWAQIGSGNVLRTFGSASGTGVDTFVELSFTDAAGSIPVGGQTGDIQLRMAKADWSNFNEGDDYSFDPAKTVYTNWGRVTLTQGGTLVWGIEP